MAVPAEEATAAAGRTMSRRTKYMNTILCWNDHSRLTTSLMFCLGFWRGGRRLASSYRLMISFFEMVDEINVDTLQVVDMNAIDEFMSSNDFLSLSNTCTFS